jgi:hypothetical protein
LAVLIPRQVLLNFRITCSRPLYATSRDFHEVMCCPVLGYLLRSSWRRSSSLPRALPQQQQWCVNGVAHPSAPPPPPSNAWSKPPQIFAWAARAFPHASPTWSLMPSPTCRTVSRSSALTDCWPPLQTVHGGFYHRGRVVVATTSFQ